MAKEGKAGQAKLTYEELTKVAQDLSAQNNYLKQQANTMQQKIVELSNFTMFKRLDYLFKVIENSNQFPAEFVGNCASEIMDVLTIQPEQQEEAPTTDKEE